MPWNTHTQLKLNGLTVELSEPVLVKRSRWYCWFPSLIRQPAIPVYPPQIPVSFLDVFPPHRCFNGGAMRMESVT